MGSVILSSKEHLDLESLWLHLPVGYVIRWHDANCEGVHVCESNWVGFFFFPPMSKLKHSVGEDFPGSASSDGISSIDGEVWRGMVCGASWKEKQHQRQVVTLWQGQTTPNPALVGRSLWVWVWTPFWFGLRFFLPVTVSWEVLCRLYWNTHWLFFNLNNDCMSQNAANSVFWSNSWLATLYAINTCFRLFCV